MKTFKRCFFVTIIIFAIVIVSNFTLAQDKPENPKPAPSKLEPHIQQIASLNARFSVAQNDSSDTATRQQYLNMEDDQIFVINTPESPPIFISNSHIKKLRAVGPLKNQPTINTNVTLFSFAKFPLEELESCPETSNEFTREIIKTSLNFVKKYFDNKKSPNKINENSKKLYELLSLDNSNFNSKLFAAYGNNAKFEFIPIAHAIKVFNQSNIAIPFFSYESIILMNISLPINNNNNKQDTWILACCVRDVKNQTRLSEIYEYTANDNITNSDNNTGKPFCKIITSNTCLNLYNEKPTLAMIRDFILSTDFGNNNIYPYTDFATLFNCKVVNVNVNKNYKKLLPVFKTGLTGKILQRRIKIYNRALVGITMTVNAGSN
ncbi:MAG: hypothetical protein LBP59_13555 [Planctomycetaceae bacterium]|jgi:hypothetical protein|nr:hypothetical protein [Planctomycetaceae bacterium]